jgi:hypothetical protein
MYAGYRSYTSIMELRSLDEEAMNFRNKADDILSLVNTQWWDESTSSYFTLTDANGSVCGNELPGTDLLYWRVIDGSDRVKNVVEAVAAAAPSGPSRGVEGQSHLPETLYRYGRSNDAYQQLIYLADGPRNVYPEASYSLTGAVVTGLMGIDLEYHSPKESLANGGYVEHVITTLPRLTDNTHRVELVHLPIRSNTLNVTHVGELQTTVTNLSGPSVMWKAYLPGTHETLSVN